MLFADLGDIRVHYRLDGPQDGLADGLADGPGDGLADGPGDGPALVFANALGTDLRIWDGVLAHLPAGLRVLRYDMRGHGLSSAPGGPYFMGDLVADAARLMEHVGLRDAVFVGLSIGGMVAQGLAAERRDLTRAVVLSNTAAKIGTHDQWHERIHAVETGGIAALAEGTLERWFSKDTRQGRPGLVAGVRAMLTRQPVSGYLGCLEAIAETDLVESTARLRLPALGIAASEDGSTPPDLVRETVASIPGSSFHVIGRAGHLACVEKPADYAAALERFLGDLGQS